MPSADDLFNQLVAANNRLEAIKGNLLDVEAATDAVKFAVNQVNSTLTTGFGQLVTQGDYTNKALSQNAKQNDTIICILEHISKNTCELLNQSVIQTRLQTSMDKGVTALADTYGMVHADTALERERLQALKDQIAKCCPPPRPEPPCQYTKCPAPPPLGDPPETKPAETKPAETKPAETKPAETKPAETKPAGTKPAGAKPAGTKPAGTKPPG
jgi:hypothetical protein